LPPQPPEGFAEAFAIALRIEAKTPCVLEAKAVSSAALKGFVSMSGLFSNKMKADGIVVPASMFIGQPWAMEIITHHHFPTGIITFRLLTNRL
jgi:hypothetical protein